MNPVQAYGIPYQALEGVRPVVYGPLTNNTGAKFHPDEGCTYKGVRISHSCLTCPLEECKHDNRVYADRFIEVLPEAPEGSERTEWVRCMAGERGVSERTIWRWLAKQD